MAAGDFTPDLLLTVGADITALRQQLAAIGQQLGDATTIRVNVQAATGGATQLEQSLNNVKRTAVEATAALTDIEKAIARDAALTARWQAEFAADTQKAGRTAVQAMADYEAAIRKTSAIQIQATAEYEAVLRRLGVTQSAAIAENEARTRQLGLTQIRAAEEYDAVLRKLGVTQSQAYERNAQLEQTQQLQRIRNLEALAVQIARVQRLAAGENVPAGVTPQLASLTGARQSLLAGGVIDPVMLAQLQAQTNELGRQFDVLNPKIVRTKGAFELFTDSVVRHVKIIGALSLVYFALNEAFAAFRGVIDIDHDLTTLNATLLASRNATLTAKDGFDLIAQANRTLGVTLNQAGDDVIVLSRAFSGNAELVRAALLPSLTLAIAGGRDQAQVVDVMIGAYNLFGHTLDRTASKQDQFKEIAVDLFTVFANSKIRLSEFETALGQVAPKALSVGLNLKQTAEILGVFSQGLQDASRSGQELRLLLETLERRAPTIARVFEIPFDPDAPLSPLKLLTQVVERLKETGTESLDARDKIAEAFGSIRTITALEAVLGRFEDFKRAVNQGADAAVTFDEILKRVRESLTAAFGRLQGGISIELSRILSGIFDIDTGRASGIATAIDKVTEAIRLFGDGASTALAKYNEFRKVVGLPSVSGVVGEAALAAIPGLNIARGIQALRQASQQPGFIMGTGGERNLGPEFIAPHIAAPPSDLSDQLKRAEAELITLIRAEQDARDKTIPFVRRQAAATVELAEAQKAVAKAEEEFEAAAGGKGFDPVAAKGPLLQALRQQSTAEKELTSLAREQAADEQNAARLMLAIKKSINIEAEKSKELGPFGKIDIEAVSKMDKLLQDLRAIDKIGPDFSVPLATVRALVTELRLAIGQQMQDAVNRLLMTTDELFGEQLQRRLVDTAARLGDINNWLVDTGHAALNLNVVLERMVEQALGVDKLTDSTRLLAATAGLVGVEYAKAAAAVKLGFVDFAEMAAVAERALAKLQADPGGLTDALTNRESLALSGMTGANAIGRATQAQEIAKLTNDIGPLNRELLLLAVNFGRSDEAALRNRRAVDETGKTYDELAASTKAVDQEQATLIAEWARLTDRAKLLTEILQLMKVGFDEVTASSIAMQNAQDAVDFKNLKGAADALEQFNTRTQRFAEENARLQENMARAAGNPFAFFLASLNSAAIKAGEFWGNLRTLAQDTAKQMSSSLSDFFFAKFTGQLTNAKDLFKAFTDSMLRAIANFLAQTVVQQFLTVLLGTGGGVGGFGGVFGGGGGSAVGGGGGGAVGTGGALSAAAVQGLASGVVSGVAGGGGGLFGFNLNTLFGAGTSAAGSAVSAASGQGGLLAGLVNAPANFSAGGLGAVAVGQPAVSAAEFAAAAEEAGLAGGFAGPTTTTGTSGLFGAGGAIAGATVVLSAIAAAFEIYQGIQGLSSNIPQQQNAAIGGLGGVASGAIVGTIISPGIGTIIGAALGGALGNFLGGLFGSGKPRLSHAQREALEANRALAAAGGFQGAIAAQTTQTGLFNTLVAQQSGSVGGTASTAVAVGIRMTREQFLASVAAGDILLPTGQTADQAIGQFGGAGGATAFGVGRQNPIFPVFTQQGFFKAATERPQDIFASIQQGVNPNLLSDANNKLAATIRAAVTNINSLGQAINKALAEILAQTVVPASEKLGQQVREQAAAFRLIVNALIVDNIAQQNRVKVQLRAATDPIKILEFTNQIKTLIEARYNDEISLVKKFGDALDQLAVNFTKVSASITQQINALQLSNFGPTNPLALYQSAQATFDKAKAAFDLNPTPENAQAVQAAVDDVIRKASEVFSRPSPEFRTIFNSTIGVLEDVRTSVDKQATDITSALAIALGTGNSIADLTQQNTAKMAADMAALRTLAEQQLVGLGFQLPGVVALPGGTGPQVPAPGLGAALLPPPSPVLASQAAFEAAQAQAQTFVEPGAFEGGGGAAQHGAWFTRGALYRLHEGEMVLPAKVAAAVRSGGGIGSGGGSVTLLISPGAIVVNGAQDPAVVGQEIMDQIEKAVRTGKLGRVIAQRVQ